MSDPKIGPLPPPDWDLPDPEGADPNHPGASFNDDHVAARLKNEEAAQARIANDRYVDEAPKPIIRQYEKVEESAAFKATADDELARRARLRDEILRRGGSRRGNASRQREADPYADPDVDHVEERVELLLADMEQIMEELGDLDDAGAGTQATPSHLPAERAALLQERLVRLELQAKVQLQLLLAGGIGLSLLGDPRVTFKRLFDRIRKWPKAVRPGRRPESDEDFDTFLAWIFEPPSAPIDAENAW